MDRDFFKEKIRYYIEMLKIFWAIFVVLTGGILTLALNIKFELNLIECLKFSFIIAGIFFEYIVIMIIKDYNNKIFCLFDKLEKN
jgi:uncharacterized membrane protein YesL